jgi:hypothetical protein
LASSTRARWISLFSHSSFTAASHIYIIRGMGAEEECVIVDGREGEGV